MTRTDGEHELILGNRQLLSAFFVMVVLLGVFFTMGYFVGKNTASGFNSGSAASSGGTRVDAAGKPVDSGSTAAAAPAPESTTPAVDPNAGAAPTTPAPETATAAPTAAPAPAAPAPAVGKTEDKPAKPLEAATVAKPNGEDMYLQVFALRRPDADNEVKMLKDRGYPALLGESSKPGIYRVMVGPFKTSGEMGRTKADLKAKGIESIVVK
jgi:cell division septation protein DedD